MSFEIFVCSHTWAKLAKTRRGKVAKMRSETLHSTMNATMNEVRRDVMFCNITEIDHMNYSTQLLVIQNPPKGFKNSSFLINRNVCLQRKWQRKIIKTDETA